MDITTLTMKDLLAQSDLSLPKQGEVVRGTVISVSKNSILIDLGVIGTGIVYPGEFYDNQTLLKELKVGQEISAIMLDVEDEEGKGYRELSLRQAQQTTAWEDIKEKRDSGEVLVTKITNINKGGLIVELNGVQGFLPLSQLSSEHYPKVEGGDTTKIVQILQKFKGQEFRVKILDFSEAENKLIVSEKAINEEKLQEQLKKFTIGDIVKGTITDVTDFGAFMLLSADDSSNEPAQEGETKPKGTIEGLIHISEMAWKMIDNPRNILSPGQEVQAKIISIENGKISLSLKALTDNPWLNASTKYSVGQKIKGTIAKTTNYGALISLDDSITGLIPIPEFGGKKPSEILTVGDSIEVVVVSIDINEHKMLLKFDKTQKESPEIKETQTQDSSNAVVS